MCDPRIPSIYCSTVQEPAPSPKNLLPVCHCTGSGPHRASGCSLRLRQSRNSRIMMVRLGGPAYVFQPYWHHRTSSRSARSSSRRVQITKTYTGATALSRRYATTRDCAPQCIAAASTYGPRTMIMMSVQVTQVRKFDDASVGVVCRWPGAGVHSDSLKPGPRHSVSFTV